MTVIPGNIIFTQFPAKSLVNEVIVAALLEYSRTNAQDGPGREYLLPMAYVRFEVSAIVNRWNVVIGKFSNTFRVDINRHLDMIACQYAYGFCWNRFARSVDFSFKRLTMEAGPAVWHRIRMSCCGY